MAKITARLIGNGTRSDPYRVNLPNYTIIGVPDYKQRICDIEIPQDEITEDGSHLDLQKLREKYKGQPAWDRADVASDV